MEVTSVKYLYIIVEIKLGNLDVNKVGFAR